jgi:GrpB-like predicted nucleotidyltransferase (UPF0157 family)
MIERFKSELKSRYPTNINGYMDDKDGFIKEIDQKAAQWLIVSRIFQIE